MLRLLVDPSSAHPSSPSCDVITQVVGSGALWASSLVRTQGFLPHNEGRSRMALVSLYSLENMGTHI